MSWLSPHELEQLMSAESMPALPIPTRPVSSDEFTPAPQSPRQREVEAKLQQLGRDLAAKQGLSRRRFFQTPAGMAAAFLAMNETFGPLFGVSRAEAATPEQANERSATLAGQFIMDMHTHFLRPGTRLTGFVAARNAVGKAGWNPGLGQKEQTIDDLMFQNYIKEIYLDSDTKIACISGAPSELPEDWFLTNQMKADARAQVNAIAGTKRMFSHAIFTPGYDGWLDAIDRDLEVLKPDSMKGYTIGDNTHKDLSKHPWHMDDEKLVYAVYGKFLKAGVKNVCVHKGLFPESLEKRFPHLLAHCDVRDVGKAARDWPQLNFIIYHGGYRYGSGGRADQAWAQFERTGRIEWVTDLSEIPAKYSASNVYADVGQLFAQTTMAEPRLAAVMLGQLIAGMGADHVCWGTDAIWTGSPQWQIEALRRLEIPAELQRTYNLKPLGAADGAVKNAIFGENNARLYGVKPTLRAALQDDSLAHYKAAYEKHGAARSNLAYGYVRKAAG